MSSHCAKYPLCKCPPDVGRFCNLIGSVEAIAEMNDKNPVRDLTKEVYGQQNPELKAAFDALSDYDKEALKRGYKFWKTNVKPPKYTLVDADPTDFNFGPNGITRKKGTNLTPKKKKRKK